jgi:hypothetical protein
MEQYQADFNRVHKLLNALKHPQKFWILQTAKERGFLTGVDIWKESGLAQPVGSKFSNELVKLGLMGKKKVGSSFHFFLIEENFNEIAKLAAQIAEIMQKKQ